MASDAPDYQRVVVLEASAMSDAPDWQEVIVGPGGLPLGGSTPTDWPPDYGYVGWTEPPWVLTGPGRYTNVGLALLFPVKACVAEVTNFVNVQQAVAINPTPDESFLALYSTTLTAGVLTGLALVGQTAPGAYDAPLLTTGQVVVPAAAPFPVVVGDIYYLMFLVNASACPFLWYVTVTETGFTTADVRYPPCIQLLTSHTAPPAAIDLTTAPYQGNVSYWFALS